MLLPSTPLGSSTSNNIVVGVKRLVGQCVMTCRVQLENCEIETLMKKNVSGDTRFSSKTKLESRKDAYELHMKLHTNIMYCPECPYKTGIKTHFDDHLRSHTGERPFMCAECGKSFPRMAGLRTHRLSHKTEALVPCPQCEKMFRSKHHLHNHVYCFHLKKRKARS